MTPHLNIYTITERTTFHILPLQTTRERFTAEQDATSSSEVFLSLRILGLIV